MALESRKPSRRRFLLGGLGVSGALIVGWGFLPPRQRLNLAHPLPAQNGEVALNGWLRIAPDGRVVLAMPRSEMGQGVHTALAMLVAEELDVPLSLITLEQAPRDKIFASIAVLAEGFPFHPDDQGMLKRSAVWLASKTAREFGINMTGGSTSMKDAWGPMREAGAAARAMLVDAAAARWQVPAGECRTADGYVSHANGQRAGYGELAALAAGKTPSLIRLKQPHEFRVIGSPKRRTDTPAKVNGSAVFGLDVRLPGMLYAAVKMSPTIGGKVVGVVAEPVLAMPGVLRVVDFSTRAGTTAGVAVIAATWWQASQALAALQISWNAGPNTSLDSAVVFRELAMRLDDDAGFTYHRTGDKKAGRGAARTINAEYRAPFLAHATMEPVNCTAQVKDGKVTVWASTQVPGLAASAARNVAGVADEDVTLHVTYLGGGFGRRLEVDMVRQAVAIAKMADGAPVQVIWSREQDITHDMYRPAGIARFSAALDANGKVLSWENKSAGGSVTQQVLARTFGLPPAGPDRTTADGEFDLPYEFPNQQIAHVIVPTPVPIGYWRSVGHSHNAFFTESFIDELAHATLKDPVEFRRSLLQNHPRHLAVLDAAVAGAGTAPTGRMHGVALHQSFGSIVAQVAEVSVNGSEITVHKVTCAVDCGIAVNPNIIAQQMESGVIFGLSAALGGEITIKDGKVVQQNFDGYPVLRMNAAPEVETIIIKSVAAPEGIGEPGVPPIAPAVANAVFKLTGNRLRNLPLKL